MLCCVSCLPSPHTRIHKGGGLGPPHCLGFLYGWVCGVCRGSLRSKACINICKYTKCVYEYIYIYIYKHFISIYIFMDGCVGAGEAADAAKHA